ncbi:MAG: hypothetical protein JST92_23820, partial [Deltaproteobacteria bacterium]|nr:hypothetical protein [Deltaproteobacteria bacterium]
TNGQALAFPNYASTLVRSTASPSTNVSTIQYSGGAFVIGATDANAFRYLLSTSSTVAVDKDNNPISFQAFATSSSAATCNWSSSGGKATFSSGENGNAYANVHHVNIHKALVQFSANDSQRMNGSPPRIGLIQTVGHDYADEQGYSVLTLKARNDLDPMSTSTTSTTSTIVGTPTGIKGAQLVYYLKSAGLDFVGAGGCPASSVNKGYTAVQPSNYNSKTGYTLNWNMCPAGAGVSGQIYDNLDVIDVANNIINQTDASGRPLYSVVWAPHWEGRPWRLSSTSSAADTCDRTCINKALGNIGTFLDDTNNSRGFLAECASIGLLEGAVWKDEVDSAIANSTTYDVACNPGYKTSPTVDTTSSNPSYCHPNERWVTATSSTASLTCPIANPNCTGYTTNPGTTLVHDVASGGSLTGIRLDNCTDPTKASGSKCVNYAQPGNSFSQIGDYRWFSYTGGVANYWPLASSTTYSSSGSVLPLLFTVASNDVTKNNTTLRGAAVADNATFIQRRNDKRKASIVYLAGHNYTPDVAGTRIALNTVLSLGFVVDVKESTFVGPTIFNTTSNPVVASSAQAAVGTYFRILSQGVSDQFRNYTPGQAAVWQFPYHTGNLRIHNLASLSAGANAYGGTSLQYSAVLPLPGSRNLFTYLGGQVTNDSSQLLSSTGATLSSYTAAYGVGVAQVGWSPESFDASTLTSASCVDQYSIVSTSSTVSGAYLGMQGNSPDGVCALQAALELTLGKADVVDSTHNPNDFLVTSELQKAQWMVQMIRGYCYATNKITGAPILSPTAADCDLSSADNTASLGGIVHSQPAIIGPSSLIPEAPSTKHRPWVAYVGGLDGQLHAFYIASDLNDIGYTGPATAITTVNASASTKFKTSFGSVFVPPVSGTELWAFIPPGQLPLLKTNAARVDASPAVADVFGDFNGSGTRTWHTVLVASAGDSNREIFALDITNPLKPSLLWDIESSYDSTLTYAPVPLQDTDIGYTATGRAQAFNWQNACRTGSSGCSQANYVLPPGTDPGRSTGGLFNYSHLGASQSVSIGTLRRNNAPVFAAFVATNEPGGNGIYVFAIDVVTGAKLWEWNNPYDASYNLGQGGTLALKGQGTGNTSPAGVSILSRSLDDQINSVYVGDDEGSLWELDASDGISNTGYASKLTGCSSSSTNTCNYKLSDAFGDGSHSAQPISTLSTIFVVRPDIPSANLCSPDANQVWLAYGTAGADTVAAMP